MSTQPIVITIVDQVDVSIAAKINGIAVSSRIAAFEVSNLQAALASVSGSAALSTLANSLEKIRPVSTATAQNVLTLSKALGTVNTPAAAAAQGMNALGSSLAKAPTTFVPAAVGLLNLSQGLGKIPVPAKSVSDKLSDLIGGTGTLANRLANLVGRAAGAEIGLGRLGGAFAGVGVAAVGAGPFIIAALAVAAVAGAILIYEKFREEANALLVTQAAIGKQFSSINDRILEQKERLAALTDGPLARYAQELKDLPLKSIDIDFSNILKELEDQHSWWAVVVSDVEKYTSARLALGVLGSVIGVPLVFPGAPKDTGKALDIRDAERFLKEQEAMRLSGKQTVIANQQDLAQITADAKKAADAQSFDKKAALENELAAISALIRDQTKIRKAQEDAGQTRTASITQVTINELQRSYDLDLLHYQDYLNKKKVLQADFGKAAQDEQLKQFNEEMDRFKASVPGGIVTAQQELQLRQQQLVGAPRPTEVPGLDSKAAFNIGQDGNVRALTKDITQLTTEINRQGYEVDILVKRYEDAILKSGAYSDALKIEADYEKLVTQVQTKRIPVTPERAQQLRDAATAGVEAARVNRELVATYNEFVEPINKYNAAIKATSELQAKGVITADQMNVANAKAARTMREAIDPLLEYKIGLQHEVELLGQYGQQLTIATEVDRVRQGLQRQGYDLDQKSISLLKEFLKLEEQQKNVQQEETRLWEENAGARQKLLEQQLGLNKAYFDGVVNLAQWKAGALEAALATNKLNNEITGGTLRSNIVEIYGNMIEKLKGAHPIIAALNSDFGRFFGTLKKGFADSIAQVLVFGGSLKEALLNTARNAVAQLISSLIELGIEFLIVTALSKLFGISLPKKDDGPQKQLESMAAAVAAIAVITAVQLAAINVLMAPAWALAEAVSLFSFGANAAAASTGIAAVVAVGQAAQGAGRFAEGGLIQGKGTGTSDDILARVSHGEFVVNAKATAKNRDVLEAINHNEDVLNFKSLTTAKFATGGIVGGMPSFAPGGYIDYSATNLGSLANPSVKTSVQMKVNVVHDGSTNVKVEQIDETTVRIIARREAKNAVHEHAPAVIATDMYNPNSPTSKAVARNLDARRKR